MSIESHLQAGSELFDSDPKGALAAYYQAVSLDPSHIEGWNQIGRLMFDLQQYSEAKMVFKRVEQLATEQNLPDWAEMAAQNIVLTSDTLNDLADDSQTPVEPVEQVQSDEQPPLDSSTTPDNSEDEEFKSIEDISNIADVTQVLEDDSQRDDELPQADFATDIEAHAPEFEPTIVAPSIPEVAPVIDEIVPEVDPLVMDPGELIEQEIAPLEAVHGETLAPENDFMPMAAVEPVEQVPLVPALPTIAPAPQMPNAELPPVGMQPPSGSGIHEFPPMPVATAAQPMQPPGPPPTPFPAQPAPFMPAANRAAGQPPAPSFPANSAPSEEPSILPPSHDAEMQVQAPKSGTGKIALMITGVVGALGIGVGAANYIHSKGSSQGGIPVIKSDAQLSSDAPDIVAAGPAKPVIPTPENASRNQAYKIGMTHLVKGEFIKSRAYLERAESLGHTEAGYNLASLYAKGNGVDQDFGKAVSYLKKSAEGGYYPAMTNLGLLYAQGQGVEQNYMAARSLWLKAAAGEHPDAMHNLAVIYATGKGVDKDMDEAIKWYRKGANAGYVDSIANLGLIYANGDGVDRDFDEAKRLWETAAGKGHKVAAQNLKKLKQVMTQ